VQTNFQDNNRQSRNLTNKSNKIDDLSKIVSSTPSSSARLQQPTHNSSPTPQNRLYNQTRSNQVKDRVEADNEHTTIKEDEVENDLNDSKKTDAEALASLERSLPIELSFLIRQQAYCMARMNYLDRQIKELQETSQKPQQHHHHYHSPQQQRQQVDPTASQVSSSSATLNQRLHSHLNHHIQQQHQLLYHQQRISNAHSGHIPATTAAPTKNGNFILSDDSGGEYSRATISDDDELSSLLDQIAKSVRPDQSTTSASTIVHHQHQAVPIFVMGSPIVPFGLQYYDDMPATGVPAAAVTMPQFAHHHRAPQLVQSQQPLLHRPPQARRPSQLSQNFDRSISAIEQLVSQKERNQIADHLNSADNWLKMRSKMAFGGDDNNSGNEKVRQ